MKISKDEHAVMTFTLQKYMDALQVMNTSNIFLYIKKSTDFQFEMCVM